MVQLGNTPTLSNLSTIAVLLLTMNEIELMSSKVAILPLKDHSQLSKRFMYLHRATTSRKINLLVLMDKRQLIHYQK